MSSEWSASNHVEIPSVWERSQGLTSGQYEEVSLVGGVAIPGFYAPPLELHRHEVKGEPTNYRPLTEGYWDFGVLSRDEDGFEIRKDRYNQPILQTGNIGALPPNGTY